MSDQPAATDQAAAVSNQAIGEAPARAEDSRSDAPAEAEVEDGGVFCDREERGERVCDSVDGFSSCSIFLFCVKVRRG